MKNTKTGKWQFDRSLEVLAAYCMSVCGTLFVVWGLQSLLPQPAYFYGVMAGLAFVIGVALSLPKRAKEMYL
jgi:uncharacterized membrane protein